MFPPAPLLDRERAAGGRERAYDTTGDGRTDFVERLGADGRVIELRYDPDGDGGWRTVVDRSAAALAAHTQKGAAPASRRHLVLIVDSIAHEQVAQLWQRGRLRLFHPPSRVISPFPVMTDPSLNDFFGLCPAPGVEALHYDGQRLRSGVFSYLGETNAPWLDRCDYSLDMLLHPQAYLNPEPWFDNELRRIYDRFQRSERQSYIAYSVGTSALMIQRGRNGHEAALVRLDRMLQQLVYELRGEVEITVLSDHGNNFTPGKRIPLDAHLRQCGYRVGRSLQGPNDVVVPLWGLVTCAAIHTQTPARVARDVAGLEGVAFAAYASETDVVTLIGRDSEALVFRDGDRFAYRAIRGDPLRLAGFVERLRCAGRLDDAGFAADRDWFEITADHEYPDPLRRLWRAFHGLFVNTPDVLLSIEDGWHSGSADFERTLAATAVHGSLRASSSTGFVMSTAGPLPPVVRMDDLAAELRKIGVAVPRGKIANCE